VKAREGGGHAAKIQGDLEQPVLEFLHQAIFDQEIVQENLVDFVLYFV